MDIIGETMSYTIIFSAFKGIIPKKTSRQLPTGYGQAATNIKTSSGEVRPYRKSKVIATPSKTMPPLTIYRAVYGESAAWFTWPFDVNVVRFPLSIGAEPRFGWTGDGEPRWAPYGTAISGGSNDYPHSFYALGIPNPVTAPGVSSSGGVGSTINRSYCYTFFSQHGEESGPSPASATTSGKVDGTWAITGMDAFPANSGTGTASHSAGVTTFTNATSHNLRVGDEVVISSVKLVVTETPTANSFKVPGDYHTATTWARVAPWNTTGMKKRLYRTSGTGGTFQLVDDSITGTSYNDTILDAAMLGDDLISQGWQPPPAGLKGLQVTSFNSLVGFIGNQGYMSEPSQPHAFKDLYTFSTDYDIVAVALSGSDLAIATEANAYVGVGSDPSTFGVTKIDAPYPCLSKRTMISDGTGALYASKHGIVYVSGGSAKIISGDFWTIDEWLPLDPTSMFFEIAYGRLYIGYTDADNAKRMLMLDASEGNLFNLDIAATSLYRDNTGGTLYMGTDAGIEEFDPQDGAPMALEWWSGEIVIPTPVNYGAAKIEFDQAIDPAVQLAQQAAHDAAVATNTALVSAGDIGGYFGGSFCGDTCFSGDDLVDIPDVPAQNTVTFTLYDNGVVKFSRVVSSSAAFRLPAGFKVDHPSVKINSQCPIKRVLMAETMEGLKQL